MKKFGNIESDGVPSCFYATKERKNLKSELVYVKRENLSRALRRNFDRINKTKNKK